jgi:hypothetical protein
LGLNAVGILFVRLVDFVLDSFIYAGVRGLPVLVICPAGFPKTTLNSNAQAALLSMCGVSIVEQRQETDNGTKAGNAS